MADKLLYVEDANTGEIFPIVLKETGAGYALSTTATGTPTDGGATAAKQDTGNTSLASIDTKLPASPATTAKQDTGNTSLASIDTKIPASPATSGKQDTGNTSLASIESKLGVQGTGLIVVSTELTRPSDTNAYAANDVVSNSTSATTLQTATNAAKVNAGSGYIVGARILTDKKSITPRIRVHLFNATNPTVAADNVAHKALYADASKRVATFDFLAMFTPADTTNSDISGVSDFTLRIPFVCAASDRNLYWMLETLDAFTPASGEKFTLILVIDQN